MRRLSKWLRGIIAYGFLASVGIIAVTLFLFWIEHTGETKLPAPTGKFAIGRTTFHWIDSTRTDSLARKPESKRELMAWVWYPASASSSSIANDYLSAEWRTALAQRQGFLLSKFITSDLSKVRAHSFANAALASEQARYPVVLMKSGIGALAPDYTTFAEELASHGYVVVGSDSPYSTSVVVFPDGRVTTGNGKGNPGDSFPSKERDDLLNRLVTIWSTDTHFILDKLEQLSSSDSLSQFYHRLDWGAVGVFGHSFGGATAAQFCRDDTRCKVGVNVDGAPYGSVIQTGVGKPFLFLLADHAGESDSVSTQILSNVTRVYAKLPEGSAWINLRGARHFNFSDQGLLKERFVSRLFGALGPIGEERGLQVAAACLRTYFDVHLKREPLTKNQSTIKSVSGGCI